MTNRMKGLGQPEEPKIAGVRNQSSARLELKATVAPRMMPLPDKPPEILPRVLFIDDEKVNLQNATAIWQATPLKQHARLETFLWTADEEGHLLDLLELSLTERDPFTAIYVDMSLKEGGRDAGLGLIERLRQRQPRLRYIAFVAVTSFPDYETERRARERGAIRFMLKAGPNPGPEMFGGFVHRMIVEANETLEQCEDQLWADASTLLSKELQSGNWREACRCTLEFVHKHLVADALFARRHDDTGNLQLIHAVENLDFARPNLSIDDVPFIRDFLNSSKKEPYQLFDSLSRDEVGTVVPSKLVGMRGLLVRISMGRTSHGLLTIYRHAKAHRLRRRDAEGLMHIANQLANSIVAEDMARTLRTRQGEIIGILRAFDSADSETAIYTKLQDALHHQIGATCEGGGGNLKSSVRHIVPGTNLTRRALAAQGFQIKTQAPVICLENIQTSSLARSVWNGKTEYTQDLNQLEERGRHVRVADAIRSTLIIPMMASGLCLGIATLESKRPAAFAEGDKEFSEFLCVAAAEALLRVRSRRFLHEMVELVERLTISGDLSAEHYVKEFVKLMFDFTRCSEILYLTPDPDGTDLPWRMDKIFLPGGKMLDDGLLEKARAHTAQNWGESYIFKTLTGGISASWTDRTEDLKVVDEKFAQREAGVKTRAQAVIVVRSDVGAPVDAIISLLFQHRHAINSQQTDLLERLGRVLAWLLVQNREYQTLSTRTRIHEQEARLGQMFGQFTHGLKGRLAKLRALLEFGSNGGMPWGQVSTLTDDVLTELERDISRTRAVVKRPEHELVDLGAVWDSVAKDLQAVAGSQGGTIAADQLRGETFWTDRDIIEVILFNLVDNALRHGGSDLRVEAEATRLGPKLHIRVHDNGKGISAASRDHIFEFGFTTSSSSTGMGLYLGMARSQDLGGRLSLERSDERGSTFLLELDGERE
jgi:signal transduction histidine kinase/GAF domain-containing protein